MDNEMRRWLQYAETDLGVAKHLAESYYPRPTEIICYHCQQAAEKALKALWFRTGIRESLPKTHNLSFLLQQIKNAVPIPPICYDKADLLTPYGIAARYPNELYIEDRHVAAAIESAEYLLHWVKDQIR